MAVDCAGIRAAGRILGISKDTVTAVLKKPKIGLAGKLRLYPRKSKC